MLWIWYRLGLIVYLIWIQMLRMLRTLLDSKILLRVLFAEFRKINKLLVNSMRKVEKTWQILRTPLRRDRHVILFYFVCLSFVNEPFLPFFQSFKKIISFDLMINIHFLSILFIYSVNNRSLISFVLKIILHFPSIMFVYSLKFQFFLWKNR